MFALNDLLHTSGWLSPSIIVLLLGSTISFYLNTGRHAVFPIVNLYRWDFTRRKAYAAYMQNSRQLLGLAKEYQSPVTVLTPSGPRIVLPSTMSEWVKSHKDLDHRELARKDFFATYPGFEGNAMILHPNGILIDTIKRHLSQNTTHVSIVAAFVSKALKELWSQEDDWHQLSWTACTTGLVSRAAAAIFIGPVLAESAEWQRQTIAYATGFFAAAFELKRWPSYTRPLVHWFLPAARECRTIVKDVRKMMHIEKTRRLGDASKIEMTDTISWTESAAGRSDLDQGAVQLGLAMASLHTTAEALRYALLDICQQPDLIEHLRQEIKENIQNAEATSATTISKLHLLDSVLKESQRLHPPGIVNLERQATRDIALPDGTVLPRGTIIDVNGSDMWDPNIYPDPDRFDGYRFYKKRESGDGQTAYVSSTKEHCVFGMGRHICPGRFFAAMELKVCLVHILLKYDMRLKDGFEPVTIKMGFYQMADPTAKVEVRRRKQTDNVLV